MSVLRLIVREILYRKLGFLLGIAAVAAAGALLVGTITLSTAMERETVRLMRDMGFNVLILPEGADMSEFWSADYAAEEMPEDYVHQLAQSDVVTVRHLVAQLQKKVQWEGRTVLLTGVLPEVQMAHLSRKPPMGLEIEPGHAVLGYQLAHDSPLRPGDTITLSGEGESTLTISACVEGPTGSKDDIRIYAHLHDVQEFLGRPGRINVIEALSCYCPEAREGERLTRIVTDIQRVLPGTRVSLVRNIALARENTRLMVEKYAALVMPGVAGICVLWMGLLALGNVRDRRAEIGVLRALGVGSGPIAALFMGRSVLAGLAGAAVGFALGTGLALQVGPVLFPATARHIAPVYGSLLPLLAGAAVLCALASYIPAMLAVVQDPAVVLREE